MVTALFYLLYILYFILFGWLFNLDLNSFNEPLFYVLLILDLLIAFALSFISVLSSLTIPGEFRKNKPYSNKFNHYYANSLLRLAIHISRIKITVTGKENFPKNNRFVLVSNHQENFDIIILSPVFKDYPMCFIAKEPLFRTPFIGKWIKLLGNVPIGKRADRAAAMSIITGIKRYKEGLPMGIFPEGKRSRSNVMDDFKPGAFKLAMKPKADIQIATIYDIGTIFNKFPWKKSEVKVHIHPLLPYEEYKDMNTQELSSYVKNIIQTKLDEFNQAKH